MVKLPIDNPKSCAECCLVCLEEHECVVARKFQLIDAHVWDYEKNGTKPKWCPIIEEFVDNFEEKCMIFNSVHEPLPQ